MQNVGELEIRYITKYKLKDRPTISGSKDAYTILKEDWDGINYRESFKVLLLAKNNKVIGLSTISVGGTAGTYVDIKHIMQLAILANASGIIISHNHPSGNLKTSTADDNITKKVKEAGKLMDITLLDHVILTDDGYYSYGDSGTL